MSYVFTNILNSTKKKKKNRIVLNYFHLEINKTCNLTKASYKVSEFVHVYFAFAALTFAFLLGLCFMLCVMCLNLRTVCQKHNAVDP